MPSLLVRNDDVQGILTLLLVPHQLVASALHKHGIPFGLNTSGKSVHLAPKKAMATVPQITPILGNFEEKPPSTLQPLSLVARFTVAEVESAVPRGTDGEEQKFNAFADARLTEFSEKKYSFAFPVEDGETLESMTASLDGSLHGIIATGGNPYMQSGDRPALVSLSTAVLEEFRERSSSPNGKKRSEASFIKLGGILPYYPPFTGEVWENGGFIRGGLQLFPSPDPESVWLFAPLQGSLLQVNTLTGKVKETVLEDVLNFIYQIKNCCDMLTFSPFRYLFLSLFFPFIFCFLFFFLLFSPLFFFPA